MFVQPNGSKWFLLWPHLRINVTKGPFFLTKSIGWSTWYKQTLYIFSFFFSIQIFHFSAIWQCLPQWHSFYRIVFHPLLENYGRSDPECSSKCVFSAMLALVFTRLNDTMLNQHYDKKECPNRRDGYGNTHRFYTHVTNKAIERKKYCTVVFDEVHNEAHSWSKRYASMIFEYSS